MSRGTPPPSPTQTLSSVQQRRGHRRARSLCLAVLLCLAPYLLITCGCSDHVVAPTELIRTSGPMAHDGGWRETERRTHGTDIYVRFDRPGEYRWRLIRNRGSTDFLGEVPNAD